MIFKRKQNIFNTTTNRYYMVTGEFPFQDPNVLKLFQIISECNFSVPPHVSEELEDLIRHILVKDSNLRYMIPEIENHMYFYFWYFLFFSFLFFSFDILF